MVQAVGTYTEAQKDYWCDGITMSWSHDSYFVVESAADQITKDDKHCDEISIIVPSTLQGKKLLAHIVDSIDILIDEWYPGLNETTAATGTGVVQQLIPCPKCPDNKERFSVLDLLEKSGHNHSEGHEVTCSKGHTVLIADLAPDIALGDIDPVYHLDPELKFDFQPDQSTLIGSGGFARVYEARYNGRSVAVKMFTSSLEPTYKLLRNEVIVMSHLKHPSILQLIAASVTPHSIAVLEFARHGSLTKVLEADLIKDRALKHRIALQVAEGLAVIHRWPIVYRDLKPDNVLIFSLSLSDQVNAKIADYGISRAVTMAGLIQSIGTTGYKAPEVMRHNATYSVSADVFSMGMLLYQLTTGGLFPFHHSFNFKIDEAVEKGERIPQINMTGIEPWQDMQDMIDICTMNKPDDRPSSEEVFHRLQRPDFLAVKHSMVFAKELMPDCAAIGGLGDNKTLWVGGGNSQSGIIWWTKDKSCKSQGKSVKSRICSVVCVDDHTVIAGSGDGHLHVFDYDIDMSIDTLPVFPDAILSLHIHHVEKQGGDILIIGLANGQILTGKVSQILNKTYKYEDIYRGDVRNSQVLCLVVNKHRLYAACGSNVVEFKLNYTQSSVLFSPPVLLDTSSVSRKTIKKIVVCRNTIWLTRQRAGAGESVVEIWDSKHKRLRTKIDIHQYISEYDDTVDMFLTRVTTLLLQPERALWVGTGSGHIVLIDPTSNKAIFTVRRHTGPVRFLIQSDPKDPTSDLFSGGEGFITMNTESRKVTKPMFNFSESLTVSSVDTSVKSSTKEWKSSDKPINRGRQCGYILVWDGDLRGIVRDFDENSRRRQDLIRFY